MNTFLLLDTETTGNEAKDFLVQVAYVKKHDPEAPIKIGDISQGFYKPPVPISIESMAVHHITEKMVTDKPEFKWSGEHAEIKKLLADENTILVAHNAKFDVAMLKKEGLSPERVICTLRVARHLDPESKIPRYNLQYLRYYLGMELDAPAHDARGDVLVLSELFARLYKKVSDLEKYDDKKTIEEMIAISARPSLMQTIPFGKYSGSKTADVAKNDRGYLEWLLKQKESNDTVDDEDWIYTLRYYLGKLPTS